jgi:TRAP-type C4-dicarboxylate transport system permease small subunit
MRTLENLRAILWMGVQVLTGIGALLVLVECLWITYGVFVRYVLHQPSLMVTEGTALLLLPLAFSGMAYALRTDAFPKVTLLTDWFRPPWKVAVEKLNLALMILVGAFMTAVAAEGAIDGFRSDELSQINNWPEYLFWAPVPLFTLAFTLDGLLQLISKPGNARPELKSES